MANFTDRLKAKTEAIKAKYQPELDALQAKGRKIKDDVGDPSAFGATVGVDFDVTMRDQEIIFDVPTATMRTEQLSLDLPEFNMVQNRIVFSLPEPHTKEVVISDNPLTGRIVITIPDGIQMVEHVIELGLPSVTMKRQDFSMDLPEFKTERIRWVIGIPEFKVKNVKAAISKAQDEGAELGKQGKALGARMQAEVENAVSDLMSGKDGGEIPGQQVLESYDKAITAMRESIDACVAKGIDPIKVPVEGGDKNLRKELAALVEQRAKVADSLHRVGT